MLSTTKNGGAHRTAIAGRRRVAVAALIIALIVTGTGCNGESEEINVNAYDSDMGTTSGEAVDTDFTIDVSRLDGSTATIPLMEATLKKLFGSSEGLVHNRTDLAYRLLIGGDDWLGEEFGEKDAIFVTYPSEEESGLAEEAGIELEIIPVVKDALVFLVNADNPVTSLTAQQIKDIYSGKIKNWKEVGGRDEAITPFQRPVNSGSQTLFLKLAMGGAAPMDAPTELRPGDMSGLIDSVALNDYSGGAIGYSVFYYASEMYAHDEVKLIAVDDVVPAAETISGDEYAYLTHYYAVLKGDTPQDADVRKLVAWMLSPDGQKTAVEAGYVPLDPKDLGAAGPAEAYGYYGSTPENTTQSKGTGGSAPVRYGGAAEFYNPFLPEDGMKLSDLFYDGVNYIDYINRELRQKIDGSEWELEPKHRFTGIPNDYPLFNLRKNEISDGRQVGTVLDILFDETTPFFDVNSFGGIIDAWVISINLPLDLSPYGAVWKIDYEKEASDSDYLVLVPQVTTYFKGSNAADAKTNEGLRWLYERAKKAGFFGPDPDYAARGMNDSAVPELYMVRDKLIVLYRGSDFVAGQTMSLAFNLRTGEEVDMPVFPNIKASSTRAPMGAASYNASLAIDGNYETAWCEGVPGPGIGEWIELSAESKQRVDGIKIINGYRKSDEAYMNNNRIKTVTITAEDGFSESFVIPAGEWTWYVGIEFSVPVYTSWLRLTIDDVYPGDSDSEDTLISEIELR